LGQVHGQQRQGAHGHHAILFRSVTFIGIVAFLFSLAAVFVGFHHSIFDFHGFRQAQTAITAAWMEHGGPFLHYETPVLGPPWSFPFEFPLYQKIVAFLAEHLRTPLNETGRAVSIAFFYLSFFPLASLLRRLGYRRVQVLAILSLVAVSPLYIFVSRLFMIESTALFFSIMYVDHTHRLITAQTPWPYRYMISAGILGILAGLVKVTTFAPYLILGCGLLAWHAWKLRKKNTRATSSIALAALFCVLLPVLFTTLWTKFADAQKSKNPSGPFFTSTALVHFNFGTLAERLHPANYIRFLHAAAEQVGSLYVLLALVVVYAIVVRRWNHAALIGLALYIVTPMIFFHLHLLHEYYPYSSAIFLIVAAGLLVADMLALPGRRAWIGFVFLLALIAACVHRYHERFYLIQRSNAPGHPEAAAIIDRTTSPGDVIVITGLDWSSELPYQSHRKAIMDSDGVAAFFPHSLGPMATAIHSQRPQTIPEMVACDRMRGSERERALLQLLGIQSSIALHADNCDIFLRSPK
jgi:hypothetical protein